MEEIAGLTKQATSANSPEKISASITYVSLDKRVRGEFLRS